MLSDHSWKYLQVQNGFNFIQILHIKSACVFYLAKTVLRLKMSVSCAADGPPKFRMVTMCGGLKIQVLIVIIFPTLRSTNVNVKPEIHLTVNYYY